MGKKKFFLRKKEEERSKGAHDVAYRVAQTHRIPYLYRSFSAKEPYI